MEFQFRYLVLFLLFSEIDGFQWFWMGSLHKNIQLMLEFLNAGVPSLAASLGPLAHLQNVTSWILFYGYYFGWCSSELAKLVRLPFFKGGLLVILIDCMILLAPFLHVMRISMSTVSFLAQVDSGILCL